MGGSQMATLAPVVFLLDVDATRLDGDRIVTCLKCHLRQVLLIVFDRFDLAKTMAWSALAGPTG